jgi:hypothetical protein
LSVTIPAVLEDVLAASCACPQKLKQVTEMIDITNFLIIAFIP